MVWWMIENVFLYFFNSFIAFKTITRACQLAKQKLNKNKPKRVQIKQFNVYTKSCITIHQNAIIHRDHAQ